MAVLFERIVYYGSESGVDDDDDVKEQQNIDSRNTHVFLDDGNTCEVRIVVQPFNSATVLFFLQTIYRKKCLA